jgi:hypothetical protein
MLLIALIATAAFTRQAMTATLSEAAATAAAGQGK